MIYLEYCFLLPNFITSRLSADLVERYFSDLPKAAALSAEILSDNVGFDANAPFSHNSLLVGTQKLINSSTLDEDTLELVLEVLDYIDFKYGLLFFVELKDTFTYDYLITRLNQQNADVFLNRLNKFLSVLTPEFLCIDKHNTL